MYRYLDKLLEAEKKNIRTAFNRVGVMGFDELNIVNTRKTTESMYQRFLAENEALYLKAAKDAYHKAVKTAKADGFDGEETEVDGEWLAGLLAGYSLVTGYLYAKEADRKRMRLNEQILTAREYNNRTMFRDSLRRAANLWWTQTTHYGIDMVDSATKQAYKDAGVKYVKWISKDDGRECSDCGSRHGVVYKLSEVPNKTHYGCRCHLIPVKNKE